jgi:hypothetical protein
MPCNRRFASKSCSEGFFMDVQSDEGAKRCLNQAKGMTITSILQRVRNMSY